MPQIWPMNWLILLFFFILTFVLFMSIVYFCNTNLSNYNLKESDPKTLPLRHLIWKW